MYRATVLYHFGAENKNPNVSIKMRSTLKTWIWNVMCIRNVN